MTCQLKYILTTIFLILFIGSVSAQKKVKYKFIYPLLQSKDYQKAEKDLLIFLEDTDDEANAYYYLGEMVAAKLDSTQIFPTSSRYDSLVAVAINAYKKSIILIDDREVRKNDEYYMAYNRRDLRTGKFGIKVSDIHLDYENKITALQAKKEALGELYLLKQKTDNEYTALIARFKLLVDKYETEESFLLKLGKQELSIFEELIGMIEGFEETALAYQEKVNKLSHPLYEVELNKYKVDNWKLLIPENTTLTYDLISYPDYRSFIEEKRNLIVEKLLPAKELLLKADSDLNIAIKKNQTVTDSTQIKEVNISPTLKKELARFPSSEVVFSLLKYKQMKSQLSLLENSTLFPVLNDSTNIYQSTNRINQIYATYKKLDEELGPIQKQYERDENKNMDFYYNEFKPSVTEWIVFEQTINQKRVAELGPLNDSLQLKMKYIIIGNDSCWFPDYKKGENAIQFVHENDNHMMIAGRLANNTFVAKVGYDMQLINSVEIDSTQKVNNLLSLNDEVLVDLGYQDSLTSFHYIVFLDSNANIKWKLKHQKTDMMKSVKMQAGIIFIYNQEDEIYLTLNQKGKEIGG